MTKSAKPGRTIESEARTRATPQQAWESFAKPERLLDWWAETVEGTGEPGQEMVVAWDSLGMRSPVTITESVPGERLVLEWKEPPGIVVWEIDVAREGGETVVKVVSSGFGDGAAWDELYDGMKSGQPGLMKALERYLDGHFGVRRRVVSVMREAARPEDARRFVSTPDQLNRWLTREAEVGASGEAVRLVLRDGRTLTGTVNTAAEGVLDFLCEEVDGTFFLMVWQTRAWALVSGWNITPEEAARYEKELGRALDVLVALTPSDREIVNSRVVDAPRERVHRAFTEPERLTRWWGPKGFTSTFEVCEPRAGGAWRFLLHAPNGTDYPNRCVFAEVSPERIVIDHESAPRFRLTATLDDLGGRTRITWRQELETARERDAVAVFAVDANEQNLDRLEAELAAMA